jgi:hypothetical protein
MKIKSLINNNFNDIAFIIGNGINRFPNNPKAISWDDLLIKLWDKFSFNTISEIPNGISVTEFYDLLDIETSSLSSNNSDIQKEASILLESWSDKPHHKLFLDRAKEIDAPVLTTNFDLILPSALKLKQYYTDRKGFTDYYPWTTYFGDRQLEYPTDGFGVWYINGFIKYHRSIRLGLSHYMGSVEKARTFIHKGDEKRLFSGKNENNWRGSKTWLHIPFNKSLCIMGLGLEENEVFLRWLLIERAKYYRKFPNRKKKGWYVVKKPSKIDDKYIGKKYFFEKIGFEVIEVDKYEEIYETPWE